jgi:uncharacterized protein YjaZ
MDNSLDNQLRELKNLTWVKLYLEDSLTRIKNKRQCFFYQDCDEFPEEDDFECGLENVKKFLNANLTHIQIAIHSIQTKIEDNSYILK